MIQNQSKPAFKPRPQRSYNTGAPKPYTPLVYQSFYGTQNAYAITPDPQDWNSKWGTIPSFGTVRADDEYYAVYAAYDKGLVPPNSTFVVKATLIIPKERTDASNSKVR